MDEIVDLSGGDLLMRLAIPSVVVSLLPDGEVACLDGVLSEEPLVLW